MTRRIPALLLATMVAGCGPATPEPVEPPPPEPPVEPPPPAEPEREQPPPSAEARDIAFPPIVRSQTGELEVNVVESHQLPVVYLRVTVRSGAETDPDDLQGLADLVATMMKEGTRRRSSAQLAEEVEFLGADIWTGADEETLYIGMRALSEHLDEAMDLLADVVVNPAFRGDELAKLKRREAGRLAIMQSRPGFLATRAYLKVLYGDHPYARYDTTQEVLDRVSTRDLAQWHRTHVVPNNAVLVAVGDVTPDQVRQATERAFARWRPREIPETTYAEPPTRQEREVLVVDRQGSVQSTIFIGNLAIERRHQDWIPLMVANQVLGGSASSRLFMDLRERRSLTYGAYSWVGEREKVAPFSATAEVDTADTEAAMAGFYEHLQRIVSEPAPAEELGDAERYLSNSFPLEIDTPGKIAQMVTELRIFGLPDDYWESYRTRIGQVTAEQALAAARSHIHPERSVIVIVGDAAQIAEPLRAYGAVTVVDAQGAVQRRLPPQ